MTSDDGLCAPASVQWSNPCHGLETLKLGSDICHVMTMLRSDLMGSLTGPHNCYTECPFTSSLQAAARLRWA